MEEILYDMIFKRKSFHLFRNVGNEKIIPAEFESINEIYKRLTPLYPEIKTEIRIVPANTTNCMRGAEYCILFYSEKKDGYLQNIGYLGEQLDLHLVSKNIATLWFGIGKTKEKQYEGLDYVIMIAIRKVNDNAKFRKDMFKSKRKPADEIWEGEHIPGVTNIIRFAPSACNTQPWFVKNNGELSVYRYKKPGKRGIMPAKMVPFYNRIDIGILLCFLDICLTRSNINYEKILFSDCDDDVEMILNAVYKLK